MSLKMTLNSWSFCFYFLSTKITSLHHHASRGVGGRVSDRCFHGKEKALTKQEQKMSLENPVSPLQKVQQVFYWDANIKVAVSFSSLVGWGNFPCRWRVCPWEQLVIILSRTCWGFSYEEVGKWAHIWYSVNIFWSFYGVRVWRHVPFSQKYPYWLF